MNLYEAVIGLEVHIELDTSTKIFCSCKNQFSNKPNIYCCPICTGMPGTLPYLNKKVVEYAIATGLVTNCIISHHSCFDRKNYFYPDLPKAYQISQLYFPICTNGYLDIKIDNTQKRIGIHEIHMEEDAGKLIHNDDCTLIDYNRCGVPLLEIVSEPDMYSADEVIAYLEKLKSTLQYLGVSDCKMQEGSMRVDINLSVKPVGQTKLGTRTEMKNMSSFKAITKAIENETKRQIELLENGEEISQQTRRWDEKLNLSFAMRSKENINEYRYFPEPDLYEIEVDDDWISNIKARLPELPDEKKRRYINNYLLSEYDTNIITSSKYLADIFEKTVEICGNPKEISKILLGELMRMLKETSKSPQDINFSPQNLAKLIVLVENNTINKTVAKEIFEKIFLFDIDPEKYVKDNNLEMLKDDDVVKNTILNITLNNPKAVEDYKNGKDKAFKFLIGKSMKDLKGRADPIKINTILKDILDENI